MLMVYKLFIKEVSYCDVVNLKKMTNIFTPYMFPMFRGTLISTLHCKVRLQSLLNMIICYHTELCITLLGLRLLCLKYHHWPL